jgi:hypothetical protein
MVVVFLAGCARSRERAHVTTAESVQVARDVFALGTTVTPEGAVPESASGEEFIRGGEVFLSVNVAGASSDQRIAVEWIDPSGRLIRKEARHVGEGSSYAPFSSGRTASWKRGRHRAVVIIDGRRVNERVFSLM